MLIMEKVNEATRTTEEVLELWKKLREEWNKYKNKPK